MLLFRAPTVCQVSTTLSTFKLQLVTMLDCLWSVWHTPPPPPPLLSLSKGGNHIPHSPPSLESSMSVTSYLKQISKVKAIFSQEVMGVRCLAFSDAVALLTFPSAPTSQSWQALQTSPQTLTFLPTHQ